MRVFNFQITLKVTHCKKQKMIQQGINPHCTSIMKLKINDLEILLTILKLLIKRFCLKLRKWSGWIIKPVDDDYFNNFFSNSKAGSSCKQLTKKSDNQQKD